MNLTTTTKFKVYAGITGTSQDAVIAVLIPLVSGQIARYLRRDLEVTTYKSWVDGSGGPLLRLEQWPILAVYQVSVASMSMAYISNTSSTVKRATVSFDGTSVVLTEVSSAGTETITEKAVATSKILSTLKTVVDAVSGWGMTLYSADYAGEPTAHLRPLYVQDALDPSTADLVLPDDPDAVKLISNDTIELVQSAAFFGREVFPPTVPQQWSYGFPTGSANIFVWYKAGYTLPTDAASGTLPDGLSLIVYQIVQDVLSSTKLNSNLTSESLGDYSYSLRATADGAVASAIESRKRDLNQYRKATL